MPSKIHWWVSVDIMPDLGTREIFPDLFFLQCPWVQPTEVQNSWVDCAAWGKYFAKNAGKIV